MYRGVGGKEETGEETNRKRDGREKRLGRRNSTNPLSDNTIDEIINHTGGFCMLDELQIKTSYEGIVLDYIQ